MRARVVMAMAVCVASGCGGKQGPGPAPARSWQEPAPGLGAARQSPIVEAPAMIPQPGTAKAAPPAAAVRVTEEQAGFPLYPGATVTDATPAEVEEGEEIWYKEVHLSTADVFDKVVAFYREWYPEAAVASRVDTPELKAMELRWKEEGWKKVVLISRDRSNWTKIALAHLEEPG